MSFGMPYFLGWGSKGQLYWLKTEFVYTAIFLPHGEFPLLLLPFFHSYHSNSWIYYFQSYLMLLQASMVVLS